MKKCYFFLSLLLLGSVQIAAQSDQNTDETERRIQSATQRGSLTSLFESCLPDLGNGTSFDDRMTQLTIGDISNEVSVSDEYLNYTAEAEFVFRSQVNMPLTFEATVATEDQNLYIFLDYNRNGEFEIGEMIGFQNVPAGGTSDISFTPTFQLPGSYALRWIVSYDQEISTGCTDLSFGQIIDTRLNINSNPEGYCLPFFQEGIVFGDYLRGFEMDNFGIALGDYFQTDYLYSSAVEYVRSEELESISIVSGEYPSDYFQIWVDLDNSASFEEGEKLAVYQTSESFEEFDLDFTIADQYSNGTYRARLACQFSDAPTCDGSSSYGHVVDFEIIVVDSESDGYCTPEIEYGTLDGDFIDYFVMENAYHYNGIEEVPYYTFYSEDQFSFLQVYPLKEMEGIFAGNSLGGNVNAWIDFGSDQIFGADDFVSSLTFNNETELAWDWIVPEFEGSGVTRARVYSSYASTLLEGCDGSTFGEVFDIPVILNQLSEGYCSPEFTAGNTDGDFINAVGLGSVQLSGIGEPFSTYYKDYTALSTDLSIGGDYTLFVQGGDYSSDQYSVFVDYNMDGDFEDEDENIGNFQASTSLEAMFFNFTVPEGIDEGSTRVRIVCADSDLVDPCITLDYGEYLEFTANLTSEALPIAAEFNANQVEILTGEAVDFFDLSSNGPTSWLWTFEGGSPASSTAQNPTDIVFTDLGCHTVTLLASNADGSDEIIKDCFITVVQPEGIEEYGQLGALRIYPNPSSGLLTVDWAGFDRASTEISIIDESGRTVWMQQAQTTGRVEAMLDLAAGMYIVQIADNQKSKRVRWIVF